MATTTPKKSDIRDLETVYNSETVKVERGALIYKGERWEQGAYVVTVKPHEHEYRRDSNGQLEQIKGTVKRFYGESAWSKAERFARDIDFGVRL